MKGLVRSLKEIVCFNQKQIIQYEYIISEYHRDLKTTYAKFKQEKASFEELKKSYETLIVESYMGMNSIFKENIPFIHDVYKNSGYKDMPRVSIKTIEQDSVLDVFRDSFDATFELSLIASNTGFSKIINEKCDYYINNDIPHSFFNKEYINPRLDNSKIEEFATNPNIHWEDFWKYAGENKYYYSSTLIIPMSLAANYQKDNLKFLKHFFDDAAQNTGMRSIWGFLCFDHPSKDYFLNCEENIIDINYMIADILSLYLMFFYNHLAGSSTYNQVEEEIFIRLEK